MVRNLLYILGSKLIPELKILRKEISWDEFKNYRSECEISEKSIVFPPYHNIKVTIGDYSYISRNSFASYIRIGRFCSIGPNFCGGWGIHPTNGISTSPRFYSLNRIDHFYFTQKNKMEEREEINIGNDVYLGMNVTVLDGVTIHDGAVIGAGAVVSKDIPPYAIAIGCPIRILRYRFSEEQINALLRIKWWDFPDEKLKDVEELFFDIDSFIKKYDPLSNNKNDLSE